MEPETTQFPNSPAEEPTLSTAGHRWFKWYSKWRQELLCCSRCGWVGTVSVHDLEDAGSCGATIECPQCHRTIGEVLFPNLRDTQEAAAQGNEEAQLQLPKLLEQIKQTQIRIARFERAKIVSVDQLPELAGDGFEFIWDIAETDGESYQVIRLGDADLWRELAFFENIDRFNQVKGLLRQEYGARFKSLTPSRDSLEWLCGDNAGKLFRLSYT
jgi:hypothetical protein